MPRWRVMVMAILLAGCGSTDDDDASRATAWLEPAVRDSAGVTILEHGPDAFARAPRIQLDSTPIAVIEGSAEDEAADISTVLPVLFLADGRLVGRDRQRQAVVIFAADGGERTEFGRQGAGPGEYGFIASILRLSDTLLLIQDGRNARLSLLDTRTGPGTEWPLTEPLAAGASNAVGMADGQVLMWGMNFQSTDGPTDISRAGQKGVLFDPSANTARRVFTTGPEEQPDEGSNVRITAGGAMAVRAISIRPLQAFPTVFGWGDRFVLADGNTLHFELRDTTGAVTAMLRMAQPRVAVTDAIWEAYISQMIDRMLGVSSSGGSGDFSVALGGGPPDTAALRSRMRGQEHADSLPGYGRLQVTPNGTLWILDYVVPGADGWAATAITPDGRIQGRITAGSGDPPVAFGDDRVAFRTEDDLGIATITVRRIVLPQ